jgi:hypothetical protein
MVIRARLSAPEPPAREEWPYHRAKWTAVPARLLMEGDRRMEAENYLSYGYGVRLAIESRAKGWVRLSDLAHVWQPSRLKGIQVGPEFGTPFLAATQVFDVRPVPRKWLALDRTQAASERFVKRGTILVTCSGSVGRATLAFAPHLNILITHDLLRVEPAEEKLRGWVYAYLRAPKARAMMTSSRYGHIIKHLETSHLDALPVPKPRSTVLDHFNRRVSEIIAYRERAYAASLEAEDMFAASVGDVVIPVDAENGFESLSSRLFGKRRRLEATYHTPQATAILEQFDRSTLKTEALSEVTERVWWMTRFKRVFGDAGVPYLSAEELFTVNPDITKRVMVEQADNAEDFFPRAGWLVMACSGQTYGLLGSVALMTQYHERAFLSHDIIRIVPRAERIRPGYLLAALGHAKLGRPLLLRYAYGTSIPHLEPTDVASFPVVRLEASIEDEIGVRMEQATELRVRADKLETDIAAEAEEVLDQFIV